MQHGATCLCCCMDMIAAPISLCVEFILALWLSGFLVSSSLVNWCHKLKLKLDWCPIQGVPDPPSDPELNAVGMKCILIVMYHQV